MTKPILVGYDPRKRDRAPLELGLAAGRLLGAPVIVLSVEAAGPVLPRSARPTLRYSIGQVDEDLLADCSKAVEEMVGEVAAIDTAVPVDCRKAQSTSAARALLEAAEEQDAALLVVGSSRRSVVGGCWPDRRRCGSCTERRLPLAVAPNGWTAPAELGTIGVAYVDSEEGRQALRTAHALARRTGARLRALTVVTLSVDMSSRTKAAASGQFGKSLEDVLGEHRLWAEKELQRAVGGLDGDVPVEVDAFVGDPADTLIGVSEHLDLLVCGSRGYGPLRAVLLGSVSRHLASEARCPLLVTPRGAEVSLESTEAPVSGPGPGRKRRGQVDDALLIDRLQFTLTITFHYLFPILTMGLALFIAYMKSVSYLGRPDRRLRFLRRTEEERSRYEGMSNFWAKIFAVNFAFGVVTGIPMEFQFGTNWAQFSNYAGGVIGTTLAMEGMFAFFAESVFLGIFLWGRERVRPRLHWIAALVVFAGSWLSGFFIIATNAWMQHPVGYTGSGDNLEMKSFWDLMSNPWLPWQYLHNMSGAAITGAFVLAGLGAFYLLLDHHVEFAKSSLRIGVVAGLVFCLLQIFPTGDRSAHNVATHQPSAFASMEGMFQTQEGAPLVIIGNPDTERRTLESTIEMPRLLSFLTSRRWDERLRGLNDIPQRRWPDSVSLVYYSYHIMVGLGTILLLVAGLAVFLLWRGRLFRSRAMLWALMLAVPFTYIANIAGWATAETGRQPWVVYGLLRTEHGASPAESVPAGTGLFTLLGFTGLYVLLGLLFTILTLRIVNDGPRDIAAPTTSTAAALGAS